MIGEDTIGSEEIRGPIRPIKKRRRKLLVVVDSSPESKVAIRFGAARAAHITGGGLILFHCIRPVEFQHWMAVAERMREEAHDEAKALLDEMGSRLYAYCGIMPDIVLTEGEPSVELRKFIETQEDIFGLVLGVGSDGGPGPLVDYFTRDVAASLPCPVLLIPGDMTYEEVDSIA